MATIAETAIVVGWIHYKIALLVLMNLICADHVTGYSRKVLVSGWPALPSFSAFSTYYWRLSRGNILVITFFHLGRRRSSR
jgi:hypothetical protein